MRRLMVIGWTLLHAGGTLAQVAPCGREVVAVGGHKEETRFFPASPALVKVAALQALPVMAARIDKVNGLVIEARTNDDMLRTMMRQNKREGRGGLARGLGSSGKFRIEISPETREGKAGSTASVTFRKGALKGRLGSDKQATPLLDEVACLVQTFTAEDPAADPRGPSPTTESGGGGSISVPAGTLVKVALREFLYSKDMKERRQRPIVFEVVEEVRISNTVVIRRGALATGDFIDAKGARGYQRDAQVRFAIEEVTSADGGKVKLTSQEQKQNAAGVSSFEKVMSMSPAFGWLQKGTELIIRAGTTYEVETASDTIVKPGS